ncbi:alpha/beta fold hydrolase [Smaragdicoccus niigatensis]|uniref:alpha/beta fold hydrolase n=1 Tax=Smaragdicoccus niigatensis TaxID=359359 RepID=UPI0003AA9AB1|nr:alpha/beta fold hydrolase [Smaragdicoccus niigatensis]
MNTAESIVEVGAHRVNVVDVGAGPAIVFVHGWQMSWHSWAFQIPIFAQTHRTIALDLPGFGNSGPPVPPVTIPHYAELVLQVCDRLGIESAVFVGNSMGGLIATEIALIAPQRVRGLGLVTAIGMSRRIVFPTMLIRHPIGAAVSRALFDPTLHPCWTRVQRLGVKALSQLSMRMVFADPSRVPDQLLTQIQQGLGAPGAYVGVQACVRHENRQLMKRISCPTLVVWGADDRLQPVRNAHRYARSLPNSQLVVYPDTGHCPQIERPHRFNVDLADFVTTLQSTL